MKVGDKIWVRYKGIDRRVSIEPKELEIVRIGRDYFYVREYSKEYKFSLKSFMEVGESNYPRKAYLDISQINEENEVTELSKNIRNVIGNYGNINISLEKLRQINNILKN